MKISGKQLADTVYEEIKKKMDILRKKDITPKLVIVKSTSLDAVNTYIGEKVKRGAETGIDIDVLELKQVESNDKHYVRKKIQEINTSVKIHGIIFQKPSHKNIDEECERLIDPAKDVDGFLSNSIHLPPVYLGVIKVLEEIYHAEKKKLLQYLKMKNITLIGKGKTGGGTVVLGLKKDGYDIKRLNIIDSKTTESVKKRMITEADIIISAVGKANVIDYHLFPSTSVLIDIGIHFDEQGTIRGDYDEDTIKDMVAYYTTTPGGIGRLTVAYLMDNVVNAALIL